MELQQNIIQLTLLEKYFPKDFEDLKLPIRIHNLIKENKDRVGYRLVLHGTPGTGKSTTSRLITKGHDALMLSGSNDFNIATMREKVYPFVGSHSVLGKQKTLIIEECENIADKIQDSFKVILDKALKVNFIFLTNEIESVNDAILSRSTKIKYDFTAAELPEQQALFVQFIVDVCTKENIVWDKFGVRELYKMNFPDFRHTLVNLQEIVDSKRDVTLDSIKLITESGTQNIELYNAIETLVDPQKFYEKLTEFKGKERECLISLGEPFFLYLNAKGKFETTLKAAKIVADYSNRFVTTISKFTTFFACATELKTLFR